MRQIKRTLLSFLARRRTAALAAAVLLSAGAAQANTDPLSDLLDQPGSAGLGFIIRTERSPYIDGGTRYDVLPLYLYEGDRLFLHASRVGIKLLKTETQRVDLFLDHRFEGFPSDRIPSALAGLESRGTELDAGISYRYRQPWGTLQAELLTNAGTGSGGTEAKFAYTYDFRSGRLALRPSISVSYRDSKLNDYYYGVRAAEATPTRPQYNPGGGTNATLGVYGSYDLSEGWRLLGAVSTTRLSSGIAGSPIVSRRNQPSVFFGAAYDFGSMKHPWAEERSPVFVKAFYGRAGAAECQLAKIITLRCENINTSIKTGIAGVQVGKPFVEGLHGLPLDFVGYLGLTHRDEGGYQPDGWQIDAFMKAYYYGFPWNSRVKTRLGFGAGVSLAQRVPYDEVVSQTAKGRQTSRLLNYLDPSIDVSLGDIVGSRALKDTFVGVGVAHRSGIFASSRLLGNVNGGSNYFYTYLESAF